MSRFLRAVRDNIPDRDKLDFTERDLQSWGLQGIELHSYQLHGVQWLAQRMKIMEGCILGDEMGLGKTCQTISLLAYAQGSCGMNGPFLVVCPLTVLENWKQELERFCPSLSVVNYTGAKEERSKICREKITGKHFHILLTTYEICWIDLQILKRRKWKILVVDEAHRLKSQECRLHDTLSRFSVDFRVLLTGTPIQNDLEEVYSLLNFIQPKLFPCDAADEFARTYADVQTEHALAEELHQVLQPFLLRRVMADVAVKLPEKKKLVVYHGMSVVQKKYYKAILMKDLAAFGDDKKGNLQNILMELRKCVNHPYLFQGVEPEPFEVGEHLVEASGKLSLLDPMLAYLLKGGHRVLLFSQMTRMMDILQDYLEYRGYSYERLDGSVRSEERNLAIKNFCTKSIFVFLLSTKAGGVGLNLTGADTVIFVDSDFNPHNDLQAEARAHRIGQTRVVKVIRLLGKETVEEIIYSRAMSKLHLTNTVMEKGRFSLMEQSKTDTSAQELKEILKFGMHNLLSTETSSVQNVNVEQILGPSEDGCWLLEEGSVNSVKDDEDVNAEQKNMYYFEGKDYKNLSTRDQEAFEHLMEEHVAKIEDAGIEGRALRNKPGNVLSEPLATTSRRKRTLTAAQLQTSLQKRQETAAKKAKLQEEKEKQRATKKYEKKMAWWDSCGYRSLCLPSADSEEEDVDEDEDDNSSVNSADSEHTTIHYVLGDVTHPQADREDAIIVHCVDDSGRWGRGGLFTALQVRSDEAKKQYELAGNMKDLDLGHVLFFPIDDKQSRQSGRDHLALIVAQQRDKSNNLSGIHLFALEEGLKKIYWAAKKHKASVHLPRIGHSTKGFNWYGTERLIQKHLVFRGIPTFIYYYRQNATSSTGPSTSSSAPLASASPYSLRSLSPCDSGEDPAEFSESSSPSSQAKGAPGLADFMRGIHVFFYNMGATEKKTLSRDLITYGGNEEDIMTSQVTHIVAEVENPVHIQELQNLKTQYPQAIIVKKKWLETCFANQRKVNASKYVHKLE